MKLKTIKQEELSDICEAMYNLNIYTRHLSSRTEKEPIWQLKSRLIQWLYEQEIYTDSVVKLERKLPDQLCFACEDNDYYLDDYDNDCERCGGDGIYRYGKTVVSYAFRFTIMSQSYCWIQPDFALDFVPTVERTEEDDGPSGDLNMDLSCDVADIPKLKTLVTKFLNKIDKPAQQKIPRKFKFRTLEKYLQKLDRRTRKIQTEQIKCLQTCLQKINDSYLIWGKRAAAQVAGVRLNKLDAPIVRYESVNYGPRKNKSYDMPLYHIADLDRLSSDA